MANFKRLTRNSSDYVLTSFADSHKIKRALPKLFVSDYAKCAKTNQNGEKPRIYQGGSIRAKSFVQTSILKILCTNSFALGLAHEKFDVSTRLLNFSIRLNKIDIFVACKRVTQKIH